MAMSNSNSRGDVTFEITRKCGIIGTEKGGWTRELNVVVWNGGEPKFDVRSWNDDHTRMTRGITYFDNYDEKQKLLKEITEQ